MMKVSLSVCCLCVVCVCCVLCMIIARNKKCLCVTGVCLVCDLSAFACD